MLSNENIKWPTRFLLAFVVLGLALWVLDETTGLLTRTHIHNEESLALRHGVGSGLYQQMLDELIQDTHSPLSWKRSMAAAELGRLGVGAASAEADLIQLLGDELPEVRARAALAVYDPPL